MRFKLIDRLLLGLLLLVVLAASIGAVALGLLLVPQATAEDLVRNFYGYWLNPTVTVVAALVVLVITLRLLYALCTRGGKRSVATVTLNSGENGGVSMTVPTLSAIVQRTVMGVSGISGCKDRIQTGEGGLIIALRLALEENVAIPEKTEELQEKLKADILRQTGLTVAQIPVMVEQASGGKKNTQVA